MDLPERNTRFLRMRDVLELVPVSRTTVYSRIKDGTFPRPKKLGRISLFEEEAVLAAVREGLEWRERGARTKANAPSS